MELLTILHRDFVLSVECSRFGTVWDRARRNVGEERLYSTYTWTEGAEAVTRTDEDGRETQLANGGRGPAVFFEQTDYPVWVEFKGNVTNAEFGSMLKSDSDNFTFRRRHRILSGFVNFRNDIGRSEIVISYVADGERRRFAFAFDVLSFKLDYHEHWRSIIEDIEAEYSMLSLDYMRRTFHGFAPDTEGERPDVVWWSIFEAHQKGFVRAVRNIIERPRQRLRGEDTFVRADKLRRIPAGIENELAEHRYEDAHLYRTDRRTHSNDTQENRFLKYALTEIGRKYDTLRERIEAQREKSLSDTMRKDMEQTSRQLLMLRRNPFFRTVGRFKGFAQESLLMRNATGYGEVYRTWNLLRRAFSLNEGMYRLQTKDMATLYEIWCFIEVSHIVKERLGLADGDIDHRNRMEMNGLFTWELGRGEDSRILFRKDGVELAELVYNPKMSDEETGSMSIDNLVSPTVAQKPDIVLRLVKDDIQKGMRMTYLFDAKYRIASSVGGVDCPPDDAINQMHRYRDAIFYRANGEADLKKEVVGGYILFPGSGEPLDVQAASFYRSIGEVNIGAFPLRPRDERNRVLLTEFIGSLIGNNGQALIECSIPQKGLNYFIDGAGTDNDLAFVGYVRRPTANDSRRYVAYYESFVRNEHPTLYYSGRRMRRDSDLRSVKFLFTNVPGNGYFRVKRIYSALRNELTEVDGDNDRSMRVCFELGDFVPLGDVKIDFDWVARGDDLHVPAEGMFITLKHVRRMYYEYVRLRQSDVRV